MKMRETSRGQDKKLADNNKVGVSDQSKNLYRDLEFQLAGCDKLKGKYKTSYGKITFKKDGSFIQPLTRESRKSGDGTNPSLGIVDEYHAHQTSEIYDVIMSGMGARPEPLMIIITTAGQIEAV